MIHTDERFASGVEDAVTQLETRTDAEVIVVAAERSGTYLDVALIGAAVGSALLLAGLVFVPWFVVHPLLLVVDVVVAFPILAWILNGRAFIRVLAPKKRQARQVRDMAEMEFHREAVHATPNRTGLLVYVSALEGRVELLPDVGLEGRIPPGAWASVRREFSHDDVDHFLTGLKAAGELLAEHVPALDEDPIDLPNAPRIRT